MGSGQVCRSGPDDVAFPGDPRGKQSPPAGSKCLLRGLSSVEAQPCNPHSTTLFGKLLLVVFLALALTIAVSVRIRHLFFIVLLGGVFTIPRKHFSWLILQTTFPNMQIPPNTQACRHPSLSSPRSDRRVLRVILIFCLCFEPQYAVAQTHTRKTRRTLRSEWIRAAIRGTVLRSQRRSHSLCQS